MPNIYNVTFQFNMPIRKDTTVEVIAEDKQDVLDNAHIEAERKGVIFGLYAYNSTPSRIELVKEL